MAALLARYLNFQPSEIYALDLDELRFWLEQAGKVAKVLNARR